MQRNRGGSADAGGRPPPAAAAARAQTSSAVAVGPARCGGGPRERRAGWGDGGWRAAAGAARRPFDPTRCGRSGRPCCESAVEIETGRSPARRGAPVGEAAKRPGRDGRHGGAGRPVLPVASPAFFRRVPLPREPAVSRLVCGPPRSPSSTETAANGHQSQCALPGHVPRAPGLSSPSQKESLSLGLTQLVAAQFFRRAGLTLEVLRVGAAGEPEAIAFISVCPLNVKTVHSSYAIVKPAPRAQRVLRLCQAQVLIFKVTVLASDYFWKHSERPIGAA